MASLTTTPSRLLRSPTAYHFAAFIESRLRSPSQAARARHELRRDADLVGGGAERLARHVLRHALHLVEDASRLDHGHPLLGVALALAHPRLRRLLRHRLVGEHADPDLAAALEAPREGHACRLDLAVGHPARLERLEPVLTERQRGAALRLAAHVPALGLAVLDPLGHQHGPAPRPRWPRRVAGPRP